MGILLEAMKMGIKELATAIRNAVNKRIDEEARAKRGIIKDGRFLVGAKSYPFKQAVDCNTSEGNRVWAQLSTNGDAVIVGE